MTWIVLALALVLVLGPLRGPVFRNWRFNVPAALAGLVGWLVASRAVGPADPWWFIPGIAVVVALGAGASIKEWLDEVFGRNRKE